MSMSLVLSIGSLSNTAFSLHAPEALQQGAVATTLSTASTVTQVAPARQLNTVHPRATPNVPTPRVATAARTAPAADTGASGQTTTDETEQRVSYQSQVNSYVDQTIDLSDGVVVSQTPSDNLLRMRELMASWSGPSTNGGSNVNTSA